MKIKLHWQIIISLIFAIIVSMIVKYQGGADSALGERVVSVCDFVGTMFLNGLKMIVVPLIGASIISGMIGLGAEKNFGRMGLKTVAFYMGTTAIAVIVGLLCVNVIQPGSVDVETAQQMRAQAEDVSEFEAVAAEKSTADFINVFIRMVPVNVFAAASDNGNMLGVIFFCIMFGFFVTRLPLKHRRFQVKMWQSFQLVMLNMADLILLFAPIGVFGLVTPKFIGFGVALFIPVAKFFICVLLALGLQALVVMSLFLWLWKVNPMDHIRAMSPAMWTAFSTSSSVSTIPLTMECMEKTAGISNRVCSFTLPLGANINMNGTALYECIVVVFVAQFYQITHPEFEFGILTQIMVVALALMTSFGVAGIPSASLVAIALILGVVGLPMDAVGIVMVVDRLLDMCRTVVNIYSDSVGAVIIAKSEGETDVYAHPEEQLP